MGLTRRELFVGPAAAMVAGGLGAACGAAPRTTTALLSAGPLRPVPCGVDAVNVASFEALTGTFAKYVRVYHAPSWPLPTSIEKPPAIRHYLRGGRHVVISFSPPRDRPETENLGRFGEWCASAAREGFGPKIRATVWHEPVHKTPGGGPEFVTQYTAYQQVAFSYGIPFGVIHNAWPFLHGTVRLADWMPPTARWDYLGIDVYAGDDPRGTWADPVETIAPFTAWATAHGRPYGVCEIGVDQKLYTTPAAAAQAGNWLGRFTALDGGCRWLCYFDYGAWSLKRNAGALIPAYRSLHHRLQARPLTGQAR